jgi:hypothetical protein
MKEWEYLHFIGWSECFTQMHSIYAHAYPLISTFSEDNQPGKNHALDNKRKRDTLGFLFVGLITLLMLST